MEINLIHGKYMENFVPPYFQWGHRYVGDDAGMVNDNRHSKRPFG